MPKYPVEKMKVLLAAHIGKPVGGISTSYSALLASSYSKHLEVFFVNTSQGNLLFSQRGRKGIANLADAIKNIIRFSLALLRARPILVHIGSSYGVSFVKHGTMALIARLFGKIVIMHIHCSPARLFSLKSNLTTKYVLFILRHCQGIVTLSREWDILYRLLPEVKIKYVPNAIDIKSYVTIPRPRQNGSDGCVNILFLGHIGEEKGVFDLVEAVKCLSLDRRLNFKIHFVGEELFRGDLNELHQAVERANLKDWIEIHPPEYDEQKRARLASTDILVLPSHHEGMPISIIEAMAAGLPVVASNVGGIPDLVDIDTGIMADSGDVNALSSALQILIDNNGRRSEMGEAGRRKAIQRFDIEREAESLISFYQEIMSGYEK